MGPTACGLVAGLIDWIEGPRSDHGRPRCSTEAVVETLRFFLREGMQWRELRSTGDRVCGATLRRRLHEWNAAALLRRVHATLVRMVRSGPEAAAGPRPCGGPRRGTGCRRERPGSPRPAPRPASVLTDPAGPAGRPAPGSGGGRP